MTTLTTVFSCAFSSFKRKQTCRVAIIEQVCLLANDNEPKVDHPLDPIEHHQIKLYLKMMHHVQRLLLKHQNELLEKQTQQNVLKVRQVIDQQQEHHPHQKDKNLLLKHEQNPSPNRPHHLVKQVQREKKAQSASVTLTVNNYHNQMILKDKI
jgi:hypothetical protein